MKLTLKIAKQLFNDYFSKLEDKDQEEFLRIHCKSVIDIAVRLGKLKNVNVELLEIAGYVHDIGYSIENEGHAQHSFDILQKEGYDIPEALKDCILNHSSKAEPITAEGKIFQAADKASIFSSEMIAILVKNNQVETIQKMSKQAIELLEKL